MSVLPVIRVTRKSDSESVVINESDYTKDLYFLKDAPKPAASTEEDEHEQELQGKELRRAVLHLDYDDDDHWTKEGLPMMEIVEGFLGYDITRKELEVVASDITRETIKGIVDGGSNS